MILRRVTARGGLWLALLAAPLWAAPARGDVGALRERIRDHVHQRTGIPRDSVVVPALDDFRVPHGVKGPLEAHISTHPRERFEGTAPVVVSLLSRGEEVKRGVVTVGLEQHQTVLVAAAPLAARARIGPGDVRLARVARAPDDALRDPELAVGRVTTRSLAEGRPLRPQHVAAAPAVLRGQRVRLRMRRGALRIEALGVARQDGAVGERVRVQSEGSRRALVGTVRPDGVVDVGF